MREVGWVVVVATLGVVAAGCGESSGTTVVTPSRRRLAFVAQPGQVVAGSPLAPAVAVALVDDAGTRVEASGDVVLSLDQNPAAGTLAGTTTRPLLRGVADFGDLVLERVGAYTLRASTAGADDAVSASFLVVPGPAASLRVLTQPGTAAVRAPVVPALEVELLDARGNRATGATTQVTLALGAGPSGAALGGTLSASPASGVVRFGDLTLDVAGAGYTLVAQGAGLGSVATQPFTITAASGGGGGGGGGGGPAPGAPAGPSGLVASATGPSTVVLGWTDNAADEDGFTVERSPAGVGGFVAVAAVGANVTAYTDGGVAPGAGYDYRVVARNAAGTSAPSNLAPVVTPPLPPPAPSGLSATLSAPAQVSLAWTDTATDEAGFRIERRALPAGAFAIVAQTLADVTAHQDTTVVADLAYEYRVVAFNLGGASAPSAPASAATPPTSPGAPIATLVGATQVDLTWTDTSATEAGFRVERRPLPAGAFVPVATTAAGQVTWSDTSAALDASYEYRVFAVSGSGDSPASATVAVTTAPAPASGLAAVVVAGDRIDLTWTDASATESGFRVERRLRGVGPFAGVGSTGAGAAAFSDTTTTPDAAYDYRVVATRGAVEAAPSGVVSPTTPPHPPGSLATTVIGPNRVDLGWTDTSTTESGFDVERRALGAPAFAPLASVGPGVVTYADVTVAPSTAYEYRVLARNAGGASSPSNVAGAATPPAPPPAPGALAAAAAAGGGVDLTWGDVAGETGYRVERRAGPGSFVQVGVAAADATTLHDPATSLDTSYEYRVIAYNPGGDSPASSSATATTPPVAPTGVALTVVSSGQVDVTWTDASATETGFSVERRAGAAPFVEVGAVPGGATTLSDTTTAADTAYEYRVLARSPSGASAPSAVVAVVTPPAAPGGLSATVAGANRVDLAWTDASSTETGFRVERSDAGAGAWAPVATPGAGATSASDLGAAADRALEYRVVAINAAGSSTPSNVVAVTTPPTAPGGLSAVVSPGQVALSWVDTSAREAGFRVERRALPGGAFGTLATAPQDATALLDSTVAPDALYEYRVVAENAGGASPASLALTVSTCPAAPTGLTATVAPGQVGLAWVDASSSEHGFRVERRDLPGGAFQALALLPAGATGTTDATVAPDRPYEYRVSAFNAAGASPAAVLSATTRPAPPTGVTAAVTSAAQVELTWGDASATETGFRVERRELPAGSFAPAGSVGANATTFSDGGVVADRAYAWRIVAEGPGGDSLPSNEATATTPPLAPAALSASVVGGGVTLSWTDASATETGFRVERRALPTGTFALLAMTLADSTGLTDASVSLDASYEYRVLAQNGGGASPPSNTASAATSPAPPSGLAASVVGGAQVELSWTDASATETGFEVRRRTLPGGAFAVVGSVGAGVTTYADAPPAQDTGFEYVVAAVGPGGTSTPSNAAATAMPPLAATGLGASTVGPGRVDLAWTDASATEAGFRLERRLLPAGAFASLGVAAAGATAHADLTVAQDAAYEYRVVAFNAGGDGPASNVAQATTPPLAPLGLTATAAGTAQVDLAWVDTSATETGFHVERRPLASGSFVVAGVLGAGAQAFTDVGLAAGTTYVYRVIAVNGGGASAPSTTVSVTTPEAPPAAPTGLSATPAGTQVTLAWTDASSNEAGFRVERRALPGGAFAALATLPAGTTGFVDATGGPDGAYEYRVLASNAGGDSGPSNVVAAATAPHAPAGLSATPAGTQVTLAWTDASAVEAEQRVERRVLPGGAFTPLVTLGPDVTTYVDLAAAADAAYEYRVLARNAAGDLGPSNVAVAATVPAPPANLTVAGVTPAGVDLTWSLPSAVETAVEVERRVVPAPFGLLAALPADATSFRDATAAADSVYEYRVLARNAAGASPATSPVAATTAPAAPTGLVAAAAGAGQVDLSWTDASSTETSFRVERRDLPAGGFAPVPGSPVGPGATAFVDTSVAASAAYEYRVFAVNAAGDSPPSGTAALVTPDAPPPSPTGLAVVGVTLAQITLSWTDAASNESGFRIERSPAGAGAFVLVGTAPPDAALHVDATVLADQAYDYRVLAVNAGGASAPSGEVTAHMPPAPPSGLDARQVSATQIALAWTDASALEASFRIERGLAGSGLFPDTAVVGSGVTAYTDTVPAGPTYEYRVVAVNASGDSVASNVARAYPARPEVSGVAVTPPARGVVPVSYTLLQAFGHPADVLVEVDAGAGFVRATQAGSAPGASSGVSRVPTSPAGVAHVFLWDSARDVAGRTTDLTLRVRAATSDTDASLGPGASATFTLRNGPELVPGAATAVPAGPVALAAGDLDGDGWPDIVVACAGPGEARVLLGDGAGGLADTGDPVGVGSQPVDLALEDLDLDGLLDLVVVTATDVRVLRGSGAGQTFHAPFTYALPVGALPRALALADVTRDGRLDVLVADAGGGVVLVLRGTGVGTLQSAVSVPAGGQPRGLALADLDRDGDPDLVVSDGAGGAVQVLLNQTTGGAVAFGAPAPHAAGITPGAVTTGDLDGDGRLDVVVADTNGGTVSTLRGNGDGTLQPAASNVVGALPSAVGLADLDRDGALDVVVRDGGGLSVLDGVGDGTFRPREVLAAGAGLADLVLVDLDRDLFPDVALIAASVPRVKTWLDAGPTLASVRLAAEERVTTTTAAGPGATYFARDVAIGDLNGDGKPDLILTGGSGSNGDGATAVALGRGDGAFERVAGLSISGHTPLRGQLADMDEDGDLDVVVLNDNSMTVSVHLNDGTGALPGSATEVVGLGGTAPNDLVLGDLDGDGLTDVVTLDMVAGLYRVILHPPLGSPDGLLPPVVTGSYGGVGSAPRGVATGDLDRDGRLDLVITNAAGNVFVLRGQGDGTFVASQSLVLGGGPRGVAVGDLTGDGLLDAVVTCFDGNVVVVLAGNGDGTLTGAGSYAGPGGPWGVALADLDRDGDLDVAVCGYTGHSVRVFRNGGTGSFPGGTIATYGCAPAPRNLAAGDLDGDGVLDLVVACETERREVSVLLGRGDGGFHQQLERPSLTPQPQALAVADLDRDGRLDVVVGGGGATTQQAFLGGGDGTFPVAQPLATGPGASCALGDLDGDGKQDLVLSRTDFGAVQVFLGAGDGSFPTEVGSPGVAGYRQLAVGDLNHDGRLDLVATFPNAGETRAHLGLNDGRFAGLTPIGANVQASVSLAHLDRDGHLDLIHLEHVFDQVSIQRGNGDGTFGPRTNLVVADGPGALACGDLDRDGDLDVVVATVYDNRLAVLRNDGAGGLSVASYTPLHPAANGEVRAVALADVDGDGDLDAIATMSAVNEVVVLLNDGAGGWGGRRWFGVGPALVDAFALAVGDLDRDGRLDVLVTRYATGRLSTLLGR